MIRKFKVQSSKFKVHPPRRTKFRVQKNFYYSLLLTAYCLLTLLCACTPHKEKIYRKSKILMDTVVTVTVVSNSENGGGKAIDATFKEMERLEKLFNFFSSESEVSRINKYAGISQVRVSPDTLDILEKALFVSENTGGAFDVTIGPVILLYDFRKKIRPDESEIRKKLPFVNYKDLAIDRNRATVFLKRKGMLIDIGGISKGYAADKAVETLKRCGIISGLVSVAGDIRAFGLKPDGMPWKIGVRNPGIPSGSVLVRGGLPDDVMATLDLRDGAISTSGDYERFFILDGKRYHHILSPKTGHSAKGCRSVSVITKEGIFTDAFATGVFVLGPEEGMKLLEKMRFDGVIVDSQGKVLVTPNIRGKVEFRKVA